MPSFINPGTFVNRINFDLIAIFHFHPGIGNASETSRQTLNVQSDDKMTEMRWINFFLYQMIQITNKNTKETLSLF